VPSLLINSSLFNPASKSKSVSALLSISGQKASGVDNGIIVIHRPKLFPRSAEFVHGGDRAVPVGGSFTDRVIFLLCVYAFALSYQFVASLLSYAWKKYRIRFFAVFSAF